MSKSRAAVERAQEAATKGNKKAVPGRYFVAEPEVVDGGDFPTRDEWLEEQEKKKGNASTVTKFGSVVDKNKIVQGRK